MIDPADETPDKQEHDETTPELDSTTPLEQADREPATVLEVETLPDIMVDELPPALRAGIDRAGWSSLMPCQSRAIPYLLADRDVMVQSRTGSGKTGAFLLPMLDLLRADHKSCQALVLVPTRELARQVASDALTLFGDSGLQVVEVYGGVAYGPQLDGFRQGAQLVVGTPGRILDHLLRRNLSLGELELLIFDEADRMLSMGFYPDMKAVQRYLPQRPVRTSMFSATFPPHVLRLADEFMQAPQMLSLSRDGVHVAETEHVYYAVPAMMKDRSLVRILEVENPTSAIIFCNTKSKVHYLTHVLQRFGYDADELSADLGQGARERVMTRLRAGQLRFLIATDVAARGIDIPELSHVIQYEPPEDPEGYIHRAGRTGRAGAAGRAITLCDDMEKYELESIAKRYHVELIQAELPNDDEVAALVGERTIALLEARLRDRDKLRQERMERFLPMARDLLQDEAELVAMLLDDYYHDTVHGSQPPVPRAAAEEPRPGGGGGRGSGRGSGGGGRRRRR